MSAAPHCLRQASCVVIHGTAVLIEGPPGTGKSALALALIDRGATLVGDDGVALSIREGRLWAAPPPNIAGLIEVRNVGLITLPTGEGAVGLLLQLDPAAPRYVEPPIACSDILGCSVPVLALTPDTAAMPLRAEWALRLHGARP
jgi:hypothetical protein